MPKKPKSPCAAEKSELKKSELKQDTLYIICPDNKCKLFWDTLDTKEHPLPCPQNCPQKNKLKYVVLCRQCGEIIILPNHFSNGLNHITHKCADERQPMWVYYYKKTRLLYKMPE